MLRLDHFQSSENPSLFLPLSKTFHKYNKTSAIILHTPELFLQRNRFDGLFFHRTSVARFEKSN